MCSLGAELFQCVKTSECSNTLLLYFSSTRQARTKEARFGSNNTSAPVMETSISTLYVKPMQNRALLSEDSRKNKETDRRDEILFSFFMVHARGSETIA